MHTALLIIAIICGLCCISTVVIMIRDKELDPFGVFVAGFNAIMSFVSFYGYFTY